MGAAAQTDKALIGICVLNWNSGPMLAGCLRHLQKSLLNLTAHIVVVDNASTDDSLQIAYQCGVDFETIRNQNNLGYAAGNNVGAKRLLAMGVDYLVFLNPDVELTFGTLRALLEVFDLYPKTGCVGGYPKNTSGPPHTIARTRPSVAEKTILYGHLHHLPKLRRLCLGHFQYATSLQNGAIVYSVNGACIGFRAEAFALIGGFDERTFLYEEELIIAERLQAASWETRVSTAAIYKHEGGHSTARLLYRRRLFLIMSEYHLISHYYRWSRGVRWSLRVFRYIEWAGYVTAMLAVRVSRSILNKITFRTTVLNSKQ